MKPCAFARVANSSNGSGSSKMTRFPTVRMSRRLFLGNAALAAGYFALPFRAGAEAQQYPSLGALAFDGDTLIAGGQRIIRFEPTGTTSLSVPVQMEGPIRALATHPARPGLVLASAGQGTLARSDDGGQSWAVISSGLPDLTVNAVSIAAEKPDTYYAAVASDGLWQSEDAGASWTLAMDRPWLDGAERDVLTLASVNLASGMGGIWLYAGTAVGLTRVPDCFCRWQDVTPGNAMDALVSGSAPPPENPLPKGEPVIALSSSASAPERLYAALPSGVWASGDGGVVWTQKTPGPASAVAVHADNKLSIAAVIGGALKLSRDGGETWTAVAA
jgi:hypothetical protein